MIVLYLKMTRTLLNNITDRKSCILILSLTLISNITICQISNWAYNIIHYIESELYLIIVFGKEGTRWNKLMISKLI